MGKMTSLDHDIKDLRNKLEHYCFWSWEYQRRNTNYKNLFSKTREPQRTAEHQAIINQPTNINNGLIEEDISNKIKPHDPQFATAAKIITKFKRKPRDPKIGLNSDEILKKIIGGNYEYDIHTPEELELFMFREDNFVCFQEGDIFTYPITKSLLSRPIAEINAMRLVINVNGPLSQIRKRVELAYHKSHITEPIENLLWKDDCGDDKSKRALLAYLKVLDDCRMERVGSKRARIRPELDLPRAVGLWMWDRKNIDGIKFGVAHKKLLEQFKNAALKKPFRNLSTVSRYVRRTGICIESGEVLPMTD
ncbi:hypothetical protein [Desulfoferula mesophila]|uniref:Uncharacterized protein n=1 Tax=Desulfoferula mesophila TaxID=3058419 RepID=A0AAU9EG85_9BACT|nr:hypothetical protein FAK_32370 [Desulfoferula mesophilus]